MHTDERRRGGLYGLLIGDALGVPYEFHAPERIPPLEEIEMEPPKGFRRSYPELLPGTWSDDGAQALCLLDSLSQCGAFSLQNFSAKLAAWLEDGVWAVGGDVFDVGGQTLRALRAFDQGVPAEQCGMVNPNGQGNGALMRVLPLALWSQGDDRTLVLDAHRQCLITHGHICNQVCCALYCLTARALLRGEPFRTAQPWAAETLRDLYRDMPDYAAQLERIAPDGPWEGTGTGYVVDSLHSAFMILQTASSYEETVKRAVQLGSDTDTTACIAGGLAGIAFGASGIPGRWMQALRERDRVEALLARLGW